MGLSWQRVRFQDNVPDFASIKAAIERLTGLAVVVRENTPAVPQPGAFACTVAFECSPDNTIEVESHGLDGLLKEAEDQVALFETAGSGLEKFYHAAPSKLYRALECHEQVYTVCIEGCIGQEPTIICATIFALESLGGVPDSPLSDETRSLYGVPVSRAALRRREWRLSLAGILLMLAVVVVGPFVLIWDFVRLPFEWWRRRRNVDEIIKHLDR